MIFLTCPCGQSSMVAGEHAGKKCRCPSCGQPVRAPGKLAAPQGPAVPAADPVTPFERAALQSLDRLYVLAAWTFWLGVAGGVAVGAFWAWQMIRSMQSTLPPGP